MKHKRQCNEELCDLSSNIEEQSKAVPLHSMVALGGRGSIAPTHS
jgi:hypothetical protein